MKNLYHPILKITAEDCSPYDPINPLRRCDAVMFNWTVSWDINKRKALWFIYPPEWVADELMEHLYDYDWTKEKIVKIIEKYL